MIGYYAIGFVVIAFGCPWLGPRLILWLAERPAALPRAIARRPR